MGFRRGLRELKGKVGQFFQPKDESGEGGPHSTEVQQVATPAWAAAWASSRDADLGSASSSGAHTVATVPYASRGRLPSAGSQPEPDGEPPHVHHDQDSSDSEHDDRPFGTARHLPTSFTSTGTRADRATASFGSTATDFDHLTSPGAQAEHDPDYVRQVMASGYPTLSQEMTPGAGLAGSQMPGYWGTNPWTPFQAPMNMTPYPEFTPPAGEDAAAAAELHHQQRAQEFMRLATEHMMAAAAVRAGTGGPGTPGPAIVAPPTAMSADFWSSQFSPSPWAPSGPGGGLGGRGQARAAKGSRAGSAASVAAGPVEESQRTTVMLRNLPNDYTRDMLVELLESEGFRAHFNFIYLPIDFKHKAGLGYAFVNMETHADAKHMWEHFKGFTHWRLDSTKVCEVAWGEPLQGLAQHIERYRNSPVMHKDVPDEYKPLVFVRGARASFPAPTRRIKPPRVKCSGGGDAADGAIDASGDEGEKDDEPPSAGQQ